MAGGGARVVVIHADDVGMCHGANAAFFDLFALGICTSGSVMVPCPWFLEVAERAAADPAVDMGIHLTLTAEKTHYKWRPLTAPPRSAGLTDANGFFWPDVASVRERADPDAVEAELRAQVETALAAGIDITHLDDHMGAVMAPEFCDRYIRIGLDYRLPILLTPNLAAYGPIHNLRGVAEAPYRVHVAAAKAAGFEIFDRVLETPWDRGEPAEGVYRAMVNSIAPGLTFMALHFNAPGELEFIEPASAYIRSEEYALFRSEGFRGWLAEQGLELKGMREFRTALRERLDSGSARGVA
jgi:chitin disaccharide deacetylase